MARFEWHTIRRRAAVAWLFLGPVVLTAQPETPPLEMTPCSIPDFAGEARCGTFEVFENRDTRVGRRLPLRVVVLPTKESPAKESPARAAAPVVFLVGGPGSSNVELAAGIANLLASVHRRHDLLLIEYRGTGESAPLTCTSQFSALPEESRQATILTFGPKCHEELDAQADLTQYGSAQIADDIDDIRRALAYPKVHVIGQSFGGRLALVYLHRHPNAVETIVLDAALPTGVSFLGELTHNVDHALESVFRACAEDPACNKRFPDLPATLDRLLTRLESQPETFELRASVGDSWRLRAKRQKAETVRLFHYGVSSAILSLLYSSPRLRLLPNLIFEAEAENRDALEVFADLATAHDLERARNRGLYVANLCHEDIRGIHRFEFWAGNGGHLLGRRPLASAWRMCDGWDLNAPPVLPVAVHSDVPGLVIAGQHDPVTPPRWARRIVRDLPNAKLLELAGGSHQRGGLFGDGCVGELIHQLITSGTSKPLDVEGCRDAIEPAPFSAYPPVADAIDLSLETLRRYAGHYGSLPDSEDGSPTVVDDRITVTFVKDHLEISGSELFFGTEPKRLTPFDDRKFTVDEIGSAIRFTVEEGRPAGLEVLAGPLWFRVEGWQPWDDPVRREPGEGTRHEAMP